MVSVEKCCIMLKLKLNGCSVATGAKTGATPDSRVRLSSVDPVKLNWVIKVKIMRNNVGLSSPRTYMLLFPMEAAGNLALWFIFKIWAVP